MIDLNKLFNMDAHEGHRPTTEAQQAFVKDCEEAFSLHYRDILQPLLEKHEATFAHVDALMLTYLAGFARIVLFQHQLRIDDVPEDNIFEPELYEKTLRDMEHIFQQAAANLTVDALRNIVAYETRKAT